MKGSSGKVLISADGLTVFTDGAGNQAISIKGTKENDICANRGTCSTTDGLCACYATNGDAYDSSDGYGAAGTRGDCGFIKTGSSVSSCPGDTPCSGHGVCVKTNNAYRCDCAIGWLNGDCSGRMCPKDLSWFSYPSSDNVAHNNYAECSDMGICDPSTGTCTCRTGFFGSACQYMGCGGGTGNPCNGHGRCLSMYELSLIADNNGDSTSITYGSDPNNQYTWDAQKIFGCSCDEGYYGYDCSQKKCVTGDDLNFCV